MSINIRRRAAHALLGLCAALATPYAAYASGDYFRSSPQLPKYQQECGTCHAAFPVRMLPAASWQRLMNNLKNHFGTDALLDPASHKLLADWLNANAATSKRMSGEPAEDRITRTTWFGMEHDSVPADAWKLPAVKSAANCSACHLGAAQGDYSELDARIPR